ncbi:MAG: mannosyltransferase [Solirubrobacteraceae bacterium]|nr:mannosyltransferase [Solirubrobacteraceae bacterium]
MRGEVRRIAPALALALVAGALLRFATLDVQSLWYDEAVTAELLRMHLGGLLHTISAGESTPPLYYVLAWLWTHAFGTGEVGLRSLSALLGTVTIGVVWALGRRLGGDRGGLMAAALVAVNPMLVWFSQEARAYALLVALAALAALLWLRALEQPRAGRAAAWSVVAALAVATHYYAIFLVAPQALWLALRAPSVRARAAALGPLAVAVAALAPLALAQRANDSAAFIRDSPLLTRLAQVPKQLLVGYDAPAETLLAVLSMLVLLVAAGGLASLLAPDPSGPVEAREHARDPSGLVRARELAPDPAPPAEARDRRADALRLAALGAIALALPVLAALLGEDHLITRNLLALSPLCAALGGAGLARLELLRAPLGTAALACACVLGVVAVVGVALDPRSQRDDWRGAVRALGSAPGERLIVASPASAPAPLRYYLPAARPLAGPAALTSEIDYVALSERRPGQRPAPPRPAQPPIPAPGFALVAGARTETFTVLRLRAAAPQAVPRTAVAAGLDGKPPALLVYTR